jgi:hypothetical protein
MGIFEFFIMGPKAFGTEKSITILTKIKKACNTVYNSLNCITIKTFNVA